jgi:hypothetical protein
MDTAEARERRVGDIVSLATRVELEDDRQRLAAIVGVEREAGLAHILLVATHATDQTDADVAFEAGELDLPLEVLVHTDLLATVRLVDLTRRMGTLGDRWTPLIVAAAFGGTLPEELRDRTGLPLFGADDPRATTRTTELAALHRLAAPALQQLFWTEEARSAVALLRVRLADFARRLEQLLAGPGPLAAHGMLGADDGDGPAPEETAWATVYDAPARGPAGEVRYRYVVDVREAGAEPPELRIRVWDADGSPLLGRRLRLALPGQPGIELVTGSEGAAIVPVPATRLSEQGDAAVAGPWVTLELLEGDGQPAP